MAKLVGYDSEDDSETMEDSSYRQMRHEVITEHESRRRELEENFASEWESFEKLIQGGSHSDNTEVVSNTNHTDPSLISTVVTDIPSVPSSQHVTGQSLAGGTARMPKTRLKRVFTEESDSDESNTDGRLSEAPVNNVLTNVTLGKVLRKSATSISSRSSVSSSSLHRSRITSASNSDEVSSDDDALPMKNMKTSDTVIPERHSSDMSCSSSSDNGDSDQDNSDTVKQTADKKVLLGPSHSVESLERNKINLSRQGRLSSDSRSVGSKSATECKAMPDQTVTQDRIRAKLIAIAEQPVAEVKKSRSQDRTVQPLHRSPSPRSGRMNRKRPLIQSGRNIIRRSRSRSRSHGRRHRSRSRDRRHRRSRSRSGDRRNRHGDHSRRRSRDRHSPRRDRPRSRERRRSRSCSPPKPKSQPMNFKEQLKAQLFNTTAQAASAEGTVGDIKPGCSTDAAKLLDGKPLMTANEKPSYLPLNAANPLAAFAAASKDKVTPQQALAQTMAAMHQKAQELTGVAVPSYYNPAAVNPLKYAEQLKKRKLLWSKPAKETTEKEKETDTKTAQSVAQWTGSAFAADSDGKMAAKFCKLMGIREQDKSLLADNVDLSKLTEEQRRRQSELFEQLDKEYAFARMTTHTRRGVGLGFGSSQGMPELP